MQQFGGQLGRAVVISIKQNDQSSLFPKPAQFYAGRSLQLSRLMQHFRFGQKVRLSDIKGNRRSDMRSQTPQKLRKCGHLAFALDD